MQELSIDNLVKKVGSIYKLSVLTSLRAIELSEGAAKLVDAKPDTRPFSMALQEISEGKISYKKKGEK